VRTASRSCGVTPGGYTGASVYTGVVSLRQAFALAAAVLVAIAFGLAIERLAGNRWTALVILVVTVGLLLWLLSSAFARPRRP